MNTPCLHLVTTAPEETRQIAAATAKVLRAGDVVSLTGDLGAGKTCFVQGAAAALGVTQRVTSPTYVLVRTYPCDPPLVHCDVFRLERLREMTDLGDEPLSPDVITFIEWGDAVAPVLPADRLEIELVLSGDDLEAREVTLTGRGGWAPRLGELAAVCEPWLTEEADR